MRNLLSPESSSKPKRIMIGAVKKTPPFRKGRRLSTIKDSSIHKSLEEESGSTKDPVPPSIVDLKLSKE